MYALRYAALFVREVGDCICPSNITNAMYEGYHAGLDMTALDTHSGKVLFTWNNLSVSNTTYAIMNDELYFLVSNPPQNSSLFKYDMAHQCMELLESGLILNLYNTGETLIYQRYQEDWHNGTWKSYQQGKEILLEIHNAINLIESVSCHIITGGQQSSIVVTGNGKGALRMVSCYHGF